MLSATLAFVTYTSTEPNNFNPAIIFSSFSLFQLLRQPLMNLPRALSSIPDALNALGRLSKVFHAPLMQGTAINIDAAQAPALVVADAVFQWELAAKPEPEKDKKKKGKGGGGGKEKSDAPAAEGEARVPFSVQVAEMVVPRGSLVAIVGPVGSGKVRSVVRVLACTVLMVSFAVEFVAGANWRDAARRGARDVWRKVCVEAVLPTRSADGNGYSVSYCPQTAWIQNATLPRKGVF